MLTLPFRLATTVFVTLFVASSLFRRAVAGVAVSAAIVFAQHEDAFSTFGAVVQGDMGIGTALGAAVQFILG